MGTCPSLRYYLYSRLTPYSFHTLNNNVYTCRTNKIGLFTLLATTLIIILGSSLTDPHAINGQFTQQQPTNSISPIGVNDNDWPLMAEERKPEYAIHH